MADARIHGEIAIGFGIGIKAYATYGYRGLREADRRYPFARFCLGAAAEAGRPKKPPQRCGAPAGAGKR